MHQLTRGGWLTGLTLGLLLAAGLVWAQEQLQLTTWYPAPRGDYQNLVVNPSVGPPNQQTDATPDLTVNGLANFTQLGLYFGSNPTPPPPVTITGQTTVGVMSPTTTDLSITAGDPAAGVESGLQLTGDKHLRMNVPNPLDPAAPFGSSKTYLTLGARGMQFSMTGIRNIVGGVDNVVSLDGATAMNLNAAVNGVRINGTLAAVYAVGSYTGTTGTHRINVGFHPALVLVARRAEDDGASPPNPYRPVFRLDTMDPDFAKSFTGNNFCPGCGSGQAISTFDDTGFKVGPNNFTNQAGATYYYFAVGQR